MNRPSYRALFVFSVLISLVACAEQSTQPQDQTANSAPHTPDAVDQHAETTTGTLPKKDVAEEQQPAPDATTVLDSSETAEEPDSSAPGNDADASGPSTLDSKTPELGDTAIVKACCSDCSALGLACKLTDCSCGTTPSDANLLDTSGVNWSQHISAVLENTDNITLYVCKTHFPSGPARDEVKNAVAILNGQEGTKIKITIEYIDHLSKKELFKKAPIGPSGSHLEVVDNAEDGDFPCHNDGSIACGDKTNSDGSKVDGWVINTCKYYNMITGWSAFGDAKHFVVSVNPYCYGDKNSTMEPEKGEYPKVSGLLHEFGHGFGMIHANSWPAKDRALIGTMQGNLEILSAYDVAFLRNFYPKSTSDHVNLVASHMIRLPNGVNSDGDPAYKKVFFDEDNPSELYLSAEGKVFQACGKSGSPVFYASWFNTGNKDTESARSADGLGLVNQLLIRGTDKEAVLKGWLAAPMTKHAQDHWTGEVTIDAETLNGFSFDKPYTLVFRTDADDSHTESDESDNETTGPITLRASSADCGK